MYLDTLKGRIYFCICSICALKRVLLLFLFHSNSFLRHQLKELVGKGLTAIVPDMITCDK